MSNKVYLTFENCVRSHVTGVYADKKLAEKAVFDNEYLDYIECLEINGYENNTKEAVEDIISTIESKLLSNGQVPEWFNEYKEVLRKKYCSED